jgi:hypothetical protein
MVELIATGALALSTVVAATAVSIGIARADAFGMRADSDSAPLAIALLGRAHRHDGGRPPGESLSRIGSRVYLYSGRRV